MTSLLCIGRTVLLWISDRSVFHLMSTSKSLENNFSLRQSVVAVCTCSIGQNSQKGHQPWKKFRAWRTSTLKRKRGHGHGVPCITADALTGWRLWRLWRLCITFFHFHFHFYFIFTFSSFLIIHDFLKRSLIFCEFMNIFLNHFLVHFYFRFISIFVSPLFSVHRYFSSLLYFVS